jgi:hypothetical protein
MRILVLVSPWNELRSLHCCKRYEQQSFAPLHLCVKFHQLTAACNSKYKIQNIKLNMVLVQTRPSFPDNCERIIFPCFSNGFRGCAGYFQQ